MAPLSFCTPEEDRQVDWYRQCHGCREERGISQNLACRVMAICYDFGNSQEILQY